MVIGKKLKSSSRDLKMKLTSLIKNVPTCMQTFSQNTRQHFIEFNPHSVSLTCNQCLKNVENRAKQMA